MANWAREVATASAHAAVTPSDTESNATQLPASTIGIYVGGAGNIAAEMWGDTTEVVYAAVPVGTFLRGNFRYIKSTLTTATLMVVQYVV